MSAGQLINASPPGDSQIRSDWIGLDCLELFFFIFFIFGLEWGALGSLADRRVPIPAHSVRFDLFIEKQTLGLVLDAGHLPSVTLLMAG